MFKIFKEDYKYILFRICIYYTTRQGTELGGGEGGGSYLFKDAYLVFLYLTKPLKFYSKYAHNTSA